MIPRIRLSGILLLLLASVCLLQIVWAYRVELPRTEAGFFLHVVVPIVLAAFFAMVAIFSPPNFRDSAAVASLAAIGSLYLAEAYLQVFPTVVNVRESGSQTGDIEELANRREALKRDGARAYPHACPNTAREIIPSEAVLGFGGIAYNHIFAQLPDGRISETTLDRFGFNNPDTVWEKSAGKTALVVGDSFAFGADLPFGEGFIDRAREKSPDWTLINLGCGGNGPLAELGALDTFLSHANPDAIIWVYFEGNDLTKDLASEISDRRLARFLTIDNTGIQDLEARQKEIDAVYMSHLGSVRATAQNTSERSLDPVLRTSLKWREFLTLTTLRTQFGLVLHTHDIALENFSRAVSRGKMLADRTGIPFIFLYLPAEERFLNVLSHWTADGYKREIADIVARNGGVFVDVAELFAKTPAPRDLYEGHFNATGAEIAGKALADALARSNARPRVSE